MTLVYDQDGVQLCHGDALAVLRELANESASAVMTDPPYGLSEIGTGKVVTALTAWLAGDREHVPDGRGFMGRRWDRFVPPPAVWDECLRVLKPGGHMLVFAGTRTVDLMGLSIRLAGFEIRDTIQWMYGTGFPKSLDVGKAIDKEAGVERKVVGTHYRHGGGSAMSESMSGPLGTASELPLTAPATDAARRWNGWGTALKPGHEPIILARKPLTGTVAANVLEHETGGLNVDGCRVVASGRPHIRNNGGTKLDACYGSGKNGSTNLGTTDIGRWPPNLVLSHSALVDPESGEILGDACADGCVEGCVVAELDQQSGDRPVARTPSQAVGSVSIYRPGQGGYQRQGPLHQDSGGASRFYPIFRYQAKAPRSERPVIDGKSHSTVKPLGLLQWLVRLITPPGGLVLDCFAGSGTTGQAARNEGFPAILIDNDLDSIRWSLQRLNSS